MAITTIRPSGVKAAGTAALLFVPAIAAYKTAVTVAEVTAATATLQCALTKAFSPSVDQSSVVNARYCDVTSPVAPGKATYSIGDIEYVYDPQATSYVTGDYAHYGALVPGLSGFLVDRRGVAQATAWATAQKVDIYPVILGARVPVDVATDEDSMLRVSQKVFVSGDPAFGIAITA